MVIKNLKYQVSDSYLFQMNPDVHLLKGSQYFFFFFFFAIIDLTLENKFGTIL